MEATIRIIAILVTEGAASHLDHRLAKLEGVRKVSRRKVLHQVIDANIIVEKGEEAETRQGVN